MKFLSLVASFLCFQIVLSGQSYKAAIINPKAGDIQLNDYAALINEASKANVDILVLPSSVSDVSQDKDLRSDDYEEAVKTISDAVKKSGIYVVAHIFERSYCNGPVRSNVVFNRQGSIVSEYRKPFEDINCNTTATSIGRFRTDFGVTFGNLMEDDLLLHNMEETNLKNFVLTGKSSANGILKNPHFSSSWSFVAKANLVTSDFIFGGRSALRRNIGNLIVAELGDEGNSEGGDYSVSFPAMPTENQLPDEDLSQYIIRPLNLEASEGHNETVCHGNLCCHFNIKATVSGRNEMNYGLIVFNGLRHFHQHNIGVQYCGVRACVARYKKSCHFRSQNNTHGIKFDSISIEGNFSKVNSSLFPTILSSQTISPQQFAFEKRSNAHVSLINAKDVFAFGVLGRDYSVDSIDYTLLAQSTISFDNYVYIYNEDMQKFFDYVWIRLRILLFVVSIYILEMM